MMPVQKEEQQSQSSHPSSGLKTMGSFGKVFTSLEGLRQRLDEFTLADVGDADARSKTLILRLTELQRKLQALTAMKEYLAVVNTVIVQTAAHNFDQAKVEALDRFFQSGEMVQAGNLIPFPRPGRTPRDTAKPAPLSLVAKGSESAIPATAQTAGDTSQPGARHEISALELAPQAVESEAERSKAQDPQPESVAAGGRQPKEGFLINPSEQSAASDVTTAVVPIHANFDQRLLSDLIKNYGEFAASPNLPATVERRKELVTGKPHNHKKATAPAVRNPGSAKKGVPTSKSDGEIDRKVKKLVKDYGEYNRYPQRKVFNLKSKTLAGVVLLAVVFLGFYFFSSPTSAVSSKARAVSQPEASTARTASSDRSRSSVDFPQAVEAREAPVASDNVSLKGTH